MVKSKKIRPAMMESLPVLPSSAASGSPPACKKSPPNTKHQKSKCNICGVSFTHSDDLKWHKNTIHKVSEHSSGGDVSVVRKSSRIRARAIDKARVARRRVDSIEVVDSDEKDAASADAAVIRHFESTTKENGVENCENNVSMKSTWAKPALYCHHCEYACKGKSTMSNHMRTRHPNELTGRDDDHRSNRGGILSCAICLRIFTHKTNLRKHVFGHYPAVNGDGEEEIGKRQSKWKRAYCCDICERAFDNQRDLLAHRDVVHSAEAPLEWAMFFGTRAKVAYCDVCCKYFREKKLAKHECRGDCEQVGKKIRQLLESSPSFECDICSLCFHWKWMYRSHRERIHPTVPPIDWDTLIEKEMKIYCKSCLKSFDNEDTLAKHSLECVVNLANKVKSFVCGLCDRSFCRKSDLQRHLKIKHPHPDVPDINDPAPRAKSIISCPYCDIQLPSRGGILQHIKDVHDIETDTPFLCVPCNKIFKRKATLDMHNQIYHPKEENAEETERILKEAQILLDGEIAFHCGICNRNVLNSVRFVAHHRLHKLERKFTCDLCGKQTRTQHQLNTHIKIIHLNIRNFECDICGKSFHSRQSCEEHRRIHTGERPFSCEICGKTFIAMNALFTHKKFHNDFFAHPCSMCPKKFKVRRSLINHIRTHTGERPYKCDLCPKTFNNSSRFSYHKKVTHSNDRPFTCDQCGSCFKANKFLMRHMKLHAIRTHVQFRRRNNPAHFAKKETSAKKSKISSSNKSNQNIKLETATNDQPVATKMYAVAPICNFIRILPDEVERLQVDCDLTSAGDREQTVAGNSSLSEFDARAVNDLGRGDGKYGKYIEHL